MPGILDDQNPRTCIITERVACLPRPHFITNGRIVRCQTAVVVSSANASCDGLACEVAVIVTWSLSWLAAAVYDPRFNEPWLLACPFKLSGPDFWGLYHERWPIERRKLRLLACLWLPNIWSALNANSSPPQRAATACRNYPCWLAPFRPIWLPACPPSPPASGIATPKAPQVAYAAGWAVPLSQTWLPLRRSKFEKSHRLQTICPKVFALIDAQNSLPSPESARLRAFPKIFKVRPAPSRFWSSFI